MPIVAKLRNRHGALELACAWPINSTRDSRLAKSAQLLAKSAQLLAKSALVHNPPRRLGASWGAPGNLHHQKTPLYPKKALSLNLAWRLNSNKLSILTLYPLYKKYIPTYPLSPYPQYHWYMGRGQGAGAAPCPLAANPLCGSHLNPARASSKPHFPPQNAPQRRFLRK